MTYPSFTSTEGTRNYKARGVVEHAHREAIAPRARAVGGLQLGELETPAADDEVVSSRPHHHLAGRPIKMMYIDQFERRARVNLARDLQDDAKIPSFPHL
jgi:hypothetical protein